MKRATSRRFLIADERAFAAIAAEKESADDLLTSAADNSTAPPPL